MADTAGESDAVIKVEKELKSISNNLTVQSISYSGDKILSVSTSFILKGNKKIMNSLITQGWLPTSRFKVITNGRKYQSKGYEMHQGMAKYFY